MSEEMNVAAPAVAEGTAQTSAAEVQTAAAVGGQGAEVNDAAFTDTANADEGTPSGDKDKSAEGNTGKKPQSKDTNAEFARKRREAERQRELTETRNKAIIDALGGKNPYTGGDMKDAEDVAEFLTMQAIEKKGGDPVTDYSGHVKAQQRAEREKERTEAEQREWYDKDRADFAEKHPDVDLNALIADEVFADYAGGKVGEKPLAEIYEGYLKMTARIEDAANRKAAQAVANAKASPGALGTAGIAEDGFYTREQVKAMSFKEVQKNLPKIEESMKHW